MSKYVCDTSVILAYFQKEKGWQEAENYLKSSVVSAVNFGELIAKLEEVRYQVANLKNDYEVIDFDREQAFISGEMRSSTKALGLGIGDRACLALAVKLKLPVVTTDKAWQKLKLGIKIICIR